LLEALKRTVCLHHHYRHAHVCMTATLTAQMWGGPSARSRSPGGSSFNIPTATNSPPP
jgi:hypothetical protein